MIVKCELACDASCTGACSGTAYGKDRNEAIEVFKARQKHCRWPMTQSNCITVISSTDYTGLSLLALSKEKLLKCEQTKGFALAVEHALEASKIMFAQEAKANCTEFMALALAAGCMFEAVGESTLSEILNYLEASEC